MEAQPNSKVRLVAFAATLIALVAISVPFVWQHDVEAVPGEPAAAVGTLVPVVSHSDDEMQEDGAACMADAKPANLDFTMKDLDGKDVSLASFKGKVILLNFWATWCGPCKFEMPAVKAIHEEFARRGDVVVVGMCLDETIPPAVTYATENGYAWQHVFLGPWQATDIPEKFGVRGIPTTVLIGPDGKVIAAAAQAAEVHRGLTELLNKPK